MWGGLPSPTYTSSITNRVSCKKGRNSETLVEGKAQVLSIVAYTSAPRMADTIWFVEEGGEGGRQQRAGSCLVPVAPQTLQHTPSHKTTTTALSLPTCTTTYPPARTGSRMTRAGLWERKVAMVTVGLKWAPDTS